MSTTEELTKRARFLRNAAPKEFQEFLAELATYTSRQYETAVNATEHLERFQGHAQQCKKILDALNGVKNG